MKQEQEIVASALLKAGAIRAQVYQATNELDPNKIEMLSNESAANFVNEIKIVPFKFLAYGITKLAEFRQKSSVGISGWVDISKQLVVFIVVILLPILFFSFLVRLSSSVDAWRRKLISRSSLDYRFRTSLALWMNRLNPYMPWAVMLLIAELSKSLLELVGLEELGIFIPYLELYLGYRIFRKALSSVLGNVLVGGNLETLKIKNEEVQGTARRTGRLIFIELALLHATEDAVRRVLVYGLISTTIWYFNIIFFIVEFNKWREEILSLSEKNLPKKIMQLISKIKDSKLFIVVPPILLALNLVYIASYNLFKWLIRYDFFKRITSEIYKKRLQDSVDEAPKHKAKDQEIPAEYLTLFDVSKSPSDQIYVNRSRESYREVLGGVNSWLTNNSEVDAIIIYGDKGIGKTSLLKKVQSETKNAKTIYFDIHGKITSGADLFTLIGDLIGQKFSSASEFLEIDKTMPKTVIFLDNAQNVFLSQQQGFDAYRSLNDLMNLQTVNVFWCLAFNRRSWDYLRGVFGQEHFYGLEFDVRSWSDVEIQKLIEERHRATGYSLTFDKVITAVHRSDNMDGASQVEAQFFRLLWGQSRGNPRAAILLWLSALSYLGDKKILVSIPEFSRIDELNNMSDETLFVLATIVRHENLNVKELLKVTNIQSGKIKRAVKFCEDKQLIRISTDDRFRITPQAQYFVNSYLLGKNFLYE